MAKTTKLVLELPEAVEKNINELMVTSRTASKAEIIAKALTLYDFVWGVKTEGKEKIIIRDEKGDERDLLIH